MTARSILYFYFLQCSILYLAERASTQLTNTGTCYATIGSRNPNTFSSGRSNGFYLNSRDSAPCNGTVVRWNFCHSTPQIVLLSDSTEATIAIFRFDSNSDEFNVVGSSIAELEKENITEEFECGNFVSKSPVEVLENDVIGICLQHDSSDQNRSPLIISSEGVSTSYLLESDVSVNCENLSLGRVNRFSASNFSNSSSLEMYLYAEIECTNKDMCYTSFINTNDAQTNDSTTTTTTISAIYVMEQSISLAATIIVVSLIVLITSIIVVVSVLVLFLCLKRARHSQSRTQQSISQSNPRINNGSLSGVNSLTYNHAYFTTPYNQSPPDDSVTTEDDTETNMNQQSTDDIVQESYSSMDGNQQRNETTQGLSANSSLNSMAYNQAYLTVPIANYHPVSNDIRMNVNRAYNALSFPKVAGKEDTGRETEQSSRSRSCNPYAYVEVRRQ